MGLESFSVLLRAKRTLPINAVINSIRSFERIEFITSDIYGSYFEYFDGKYLIEILIRGHDTEPEFDISVKFALCNEDGVENIFLNFVKWIIECWNPSIYLLSSVLKQKNFYDEKETHLFLENAHSEIQALRSLWQRNFGIKRSALRANDVYEWLEKSD